MQAVILAGGLGTRLRPLTYTTPKPMIPINKKPFLLYQLELLKKDGITDIILCVGYLSEQFKNYFGDGSKFGLNIKYSVEGKPLGTGGALKNAEKYINGKFMLLNGDTYLPIDYRKLIDFFNETGVMVVYKNKNKIMKNNVAINRDNLVVDYNKKDDKGMNMVDAGVQVFKKEILSLIPKNRVISLEEEIFSKLIKMKELIAYTTDQMFYDMGSFEDLKIIEGVL